MSRNLSTHFVTPPPPQQRSHYNSLQEAVKDSLTLLLHLKNNEPYLTTQYELEVRLGRLVTHGGTQMTARSTISGAEYVFQAGITHFFDTNIGKETFYRCSEILLSPNLRPLCYSISPIETTYVLVQGTSSARYIVDADGKNYSSQVKNRIANPIDFIGTTQREMATVPMALRISACLEHDCGNDKSKFPEDIDAAPRRKRERRSIYFFDTTGFAASPTAWSNVYALVCKHESGFDGIEINPWRVDLTRVNDGESFQIELEFDFALAWRIYTNNETAKSMSTEMAERYFRVRSLAALGECIFRVQYAIDPATPTSWLRKL